MNVGALREQFLDDEACLGFFESESTFSYQPKVISF